jgi:multiple sugar transport system substrate-binding protein
MSNGIEEVRVSRRKLLAGAAGVAGSVAAGSLFGPELAAAIPRRRLAGATTVTLMTNNGEITNADIAAFQDKNPNINIQWIVTDGPRFQAMLAAGTPPDLFRVQAPLVPQFAKRHQIKNLDTYFAQSDLIHPGDLTPANNYYKFDGKTVGKGARYGMVKDWSPDLTVFVRTDILKSLKIEIPGPTDAWTYDDLWNMAVKIKKAKKAKWVLDTADSLGWIDRVVMALLVAQGAKPLYSADFSKMNLTKNPAAMQIFQYFYRYSQQKMDLGPENPDPDGWSGAAFNAGKCAMTQYGFWFSGQVSSDKKALANTRMLTAPTWKHGKNVDPTVTATGWVMAEATNHPDEAWTVFEWYMGGKPARDRAGIGWGVPAQKSLFDRIPQTNTFQKNAYKTLLHELPRSDVTLQFNPNLIGLNDRTAVAQSYIKYLPDALAGHISFTKFMSKVESDTNRAIEVGKNG